MRRFRLYHLDYCPYCRRVRREAQRLGIDLELVEIDEQSGAREKLLEARGRATVPVLEVLSPAGEPELLLGESQDIIELLREIAESGKAEHAA